jgi:hypothetical protein
MLIDQMKEHPEEFRGYAGKFTNMLDMAREANQGLQRNVKMSQRDAAAILAAAETHLYEVWLAEDVLTTIMRPKPEVEEPKYKVGSGVLRQGAISNAALYNNAISNLSTDQYAEQAYQIELAKYKAELAKQRQQENEYALRITKPFKPFI